MPHNASPDLAAGSWSSMVGEAVVNERNARLAQPTGTVEDLRVLTLLAPPMPATVRYDVDREAYTITWTFLSGDDLIVPGYTLAQIMSLFTPDAATVKALHTIRAQSLSPVSFVDTPEPRSES